jgi:adenylate kinase family enzyme
VVSSPVVQRVSVVGTSGSGKSILARELARALDVPVVELDALHWLPGWAERPDEEFAAAVAQAAAGERWVIDGNYSKGVAHDQARHPPPGAVGRQLRAVAELLQPGPL